MYTEKKIKGQGRVHFEEKCELISTYKNKIPEGRSQDGGGIGRVITFSSTNSLKEQQNGEQSLQHNFWSLAADIRRPEKRPIVFEGR